MELTRVLIDTNVCLDAALHRRPFADTAAKILLLSEKGIYTGLLASHSLDTIFYFLNKKYNYSKSYKAIEGLRKAIGIADVTKEVIDAAIRLKWKDFEDAIHHEAALASGCEAIITRNVKDFTGSELPVFEPVDFLDELNM